MKHAETNTSWVKIDKELPIYYECVFIELKTGEVLEAWRASDGKRSMWTRYGGDEVFSSAEIARWRPHELKYKEL